MGTDRPLLIVAGMHRSGTTLVTRAIGEAGLFVGRPEHLMPAAGSNPDGHWELVRVARLNDDILAAAGAHWAGPVTRADDATLTRLTDGPLGDDARSVLDNELANVTVVKDPRFCLTLPFWRRLLDDRIALVVPWRHPYAVARSLADRNQFPEEFGRMLWDTYHRRLTAGAAGLPRHVVAHDELLAGPATVLSRLWDFISEQTGLEPSRSLEPPTRPELVHHHVDDRLSSAQAELLDALTADGAVPVLSTPEDQRRELVYGVAAAIGNEHDRLRAIMVGHERRAVETTT